MKPDFAIVAIRNVEDYTAVEIDTNHATHQGRKWKELGDWGKRKFENLLILTRPKERIKIVYI